MKPPRKQGAHLIVQLKENQVALCRKVKASLENAKPLSGVQTVDPNKRNRHETRVIGVFDAAEAVRGSAWEPYVAAVI